jgi:glucose/arabinose dehydrogenase
LGFQNQGDPALSGESSWNSRYHAQSSWLTAGGDIAGSASASTPITGLGNYNWSSTGLIDDVQYWITNGNNFGWLLLSQLEGTQKTARQFGSREGGTPATLTLGYTAPPPPMINKEVSTNGLVEIQWDALTSLKYDIRFNTNLLDESQWLLAEGNIAASPNGTNTWRNPAYAASPTNPAVNHIAYRVDMLNKSPAPLELNFEIAASNLVSPVVLTHAGDGTGRRFIAEQTGEILILDSGNTLLPTPFLDISDLMTNLTVFSGFGNTNAGLNPSYDERGLLGLAFHPSYPTNGRFFVYFSSPKTGSGINHESILAEYTVSTTNADIADASSQRIVLRVDQPEFNHNGGQLAFGPDGYLYLGLGDGGGAGDIHGLYGNGQNISNLLGSIIRIDVDGALPYSIPPDNPFGSSPGSDEIFAYGMRNPYRFSFDSISGDLFVADVGQNQWEEIHIVTNGGNYGWNILEGLHAYSISSATSANVNIPDLRAPIHEYEHGDLGISVIGGYVYRGSTFPELEGKYVFGDFSTSFSTPDGQLYYLEESRPDIWERFEFTLPGGTPLQRYVKGFGEDENGELYILSSTNLGPSGNSADVRKLVSP